MLINKNAQKIAKVLGNFDFVKTHTVMEELGWKWYLTDDLPEVCDLVDMAFSLLHKAINGNGFCSSGGFEAVFNDGELVLKFVIEESTVGEDNDNN